jgi:uncharacterized membrane protein
MQQSDLGTTKSGMQPNIAGTLCYTPFFFIGLIASLYFYFTEKDNKFVRFHAVQSLVMTGIGLVLVVPLYILAMPVGAIVGLVFLGLAI